MKKILFAVSAYAMPMAVFAQDGIEGIVETFGNIIGALTPIVIALALLYFFWGLAKYILAQGEEEKKGGKDIMIWGIIALFVMVAVWGIIGIIAETVDVEVGGDLDEIPGVNLD